MKIHLDGVLQDVESTDGWLYGTGIFETIKTVDSKPYSLARHLNRAQRSAAELNISIPANEVIQNLVFQTLKAEPHKLGLLRISFAQNSRLLIVHLPYQAPIGALDLRLHPSTVNGFVHKEFPYAERLAILAAAKNAGFDDALTINNADKICEGSVTNLIAKIGEVWITPPVTDGVLPGIMREILIENNLVSEKSISRDSLGDVSSAFLLSSLRIAQPISSIEGRALHLSHALGAKIHALAVEYSVG
jgi:branched-chain amino acid aminotransferase